MFCLSCSIKRYLILKERNQQSFNVIYIYHIYNLSRPLHSCRKLLDINIEKRKNRATLNCGSYTCWGRLTLASLNTLIARAIAILVPVLTSAVGLQLWCLAHGVGPVAGGAALHAYLNYNTDISTGTQKYIFEQKLGFGAILSFGKSYGLMAKHHKIQIPGNNLQTETG